MSIFENNEEQESIIQKRYFSIKEKSIKILEGEKNRCKAMFDELWNGLTLEQAQELLDLFGDNAISLFQMHGAWQQFIKQISPSYEILQPPFNFDIVDGKVVLSEKPVVEEPVIEEPDIPIIDETIVPI